MIKPTATIIDNESKIIFCNSPIRIRLQDSTILSAKIFLWIWNGHLNKSLGYPNYILESSKISIADDFINFEIQDNIKAFLVHPDNANNTDQPQFAYNELFPAVQTGQGVFVHYTYELTNATGTYIDQSVTYFSTLGYKDETEWTFITPPQPLNVYQPRYYNPQIHDYFINTFDFSHSLSVCTSQNMVFSDPLTPTDYLRNTKDPYLIVFLNKQGLWEQFTPNGKVIISEKNDFRTSNRSYRDLSTIDNAFNHFKLRQRTNTVTTYQINTGSLEQEMVSIVDQIIKSPKIYLIKFEGDTQLTGTIGITIDNTFVTVDDTTITIDSQSVRDNYIGLYKTHLQIPVICTENDFVFKNRMNDKTKIDYTLKFEQAL